MPRRLRRDYPGAWHHVVDRGIARRPIFESRKDIRRFLSELARQVRAGLLEVHVYSVLTTHFHLLVRSPRGRLSDAMQQVLDRYARWFNRSRRRDGPLFRGRFVNRIIESEAYFCATLRYIDRNPVQAGLSGRATEYPYGSALHYARLRGPRWLTRSAIEGLVSDRPGLPWDPARYLEFETMSAGDPGLWVVERRLQSEAVAERDPLDDLILAAPGRVREWMLRKAKLADATEVGLPVASPETLTRSIDAFLRREGDSIVTVGRRRAPLGELARAGLLRHAAGLRIEEIARSLGLSYGTAWSRVDLFRDAISVNEQLLAGASAVLGEALQAEHGRRPGLRGRIASLLGRGRARRVARLPTSRVGSEARREAEVR